MSSPPARPSPAMCCGSFCCQRGCACVGGVFPTSNKSLFALQRAPCSSRMQFLSANRIYKAPTGTVYAGVCIRVGVPGSQPHVYMCMHHHTGVYIWQIHIRAQTHTCTCGHAVATCASYASRQQHSLPSSEMIDSSIDRPLLDFSYLLLVFVESSARPAMDVPFTGCWVWGIPWP